ncbi:type I pullulanase [Clostridium weizhouense]|uniref:Type I pullulanase n=1 Tax=Clostridium weizhouense TaxID=2859781 RepID=A0ABS7AKZ1_9CLOT|nr:type I pullulanase [Clostridium weizhouense]MBW6409326.1 type I pullulanase [Clostridium weizhouense]
MSVHKILYSQENYKDKLGAIYSTHKTQFILWAPTSTQVKVILYYNNITEIINMEKEEMGIWCIEVEGDLNGVYYNYIVTNNGIEKEVVDPYAKAVGVNGNRGMVVDLEATNPVGWDHDTKPKLIDSTDSIIYEIHVRDFSISKTSGIASKLRGKYSGICEHRTTIPETKEKTGLDYLIDLGITHVHLMPVFDYATVDESKFDPKDYNWGYDPKNYNVPEGSYAINPFSGAERIKEFKKMIQELHKSGIRIVMDVVYNHTYRTHNSNFNLIVPNYYYRQNPDGSFSNGSGCGNEFASERKMVRKFIIDSILYWANEYHIDGFRFDLMGLYDIEMIKEIRRKLDLIDESIILYGEGWTGGSSPLPEWDRSLKYNISKYGDMQMAAFSDDIRDGVKGNVFDANSVGFVNGANGLEETIKFGVVASVKHDQINYDRSIYSKFPWANEPYQSINYMSAHDNYTLWDKLCIGSKNYSKEELKSINKLSAGILFTSQGLVFFQAGEEFLRSKVNEDGSINHNSYNSPDSVNALDWNRILKYKDVVDYYKGLIRLRKAHKCFRMTTGEDIRENLRFLERGINFYEDRVVAFSIKEYLTDLYCNDIVVVYNANKNSVEVNLNEKGWSVVVNEHAAGNIQLQYIDSDKVSVAGISCYVLIHDNTK